MINSDQKPHIVIDARIRRTSTGRYTDRLIENLQAIDHQNRYSILVQPDDPWEPRAKNFKRVNCKYKQFSFSPFEQIGYSWQLYKLKPDLVHFTMTQFPILFFGNIVVTTHDLGMLTTTRPKYSKIVFQLKLWGYKFLLWQAHRKAKRIIVPTDFVKNEVVKYHQFTANKIARTYESSDSQKDVKAKKPAWIKTDQFIMYQGTAFPHKNTSKLVDAFNLLANKYPKLHLYFNGKKEFYYEKLEAYIKELSDSSRVHVNGFVPDDESKWMYEHAQAYVTPTEHEGFGLTGLEAMAQGTPVICSDIPVLREVYGDAAEYFDPNDINDMSAKISEVLDNPDLRENLSQAGRRQAAKYSWSKMAAQTLAIYKEILG